MDQQKEKVLVQFQILNERKRECFCVIMMMPSRLDCRLKEWKLSESEAIVKSNLSQSYVYGRMAMELNKVVINERTQKVTIFGLGKIF